MQELQVTVIAGNFRSAMGTPIFLSGMAGFKKYVYKDNDLEHTGIALTRFYYRK